MPLEHAFSRFGFQDNRSYGKEEDTIGVESRLRRYAKGGKAYSVIRSFFYWMDVMSREDRKAWRKRATQVKAMIINCHGGPLNYIKNKDKSGMIRLMNRHLDKEEARYLMSGLHKRKATPNWPTARKRY